MTYSNVVYDIVGSLKECLVGIIVVGSAAWSPKTSRDIDIDIVLERFDLLRFADLKKITDQEFSVVLESFVSNGLDKVLAMDIRMFSLKFFQEGTEVSLRFSDKKIFDFVCGLDLAKIQHTVSVMHYRTTQTRPFDNQKNFAGEGISYECWDFTDNIGCLIEAPIAIIDNQNNFYPGQVIDRFIAFPIIVYEKDGYCSGNLERLFVNVVKRLIFEQHRN